MQISRRTFLLGSGAAAGALALGGPAATTALASPWRIRSAQALTSDPFTLGIASGDPLPDAVVLWTRLAPRPLEGGGMPDASMAVHWEVATDESFAAVVRRGAALAQPGLGHSVHVDVDGLEPAREYWYRFRAGRWISPAGRTRTAPAYGASPQALSFAFASCQNWQAGYYTAYRDMAAQDLDFVVHLGDYIYEGGPKGPGSAGPPDRVHNSDEVKTVEEYRNRYALYRSDADLRLAHERFPWVVTWDDHEFDNNYASFISDNVDDDPAAFAQRRADAYQVYYEHMPLRVRPSGPDLALYRRLRFGDLLNVHVLDTRQYRSDQACETDLANCDDRKAETQRMTGAEQERWLLDGLGQSTARWDTLAQQVVFAEIDFSPTPGSEGAAGLFNTDQWDGYAAERRRITEFLAGPDGPRNTVVLTGDIHASWVNDVKTDYDDPSSPTVATEFVGTSISSTFGTDALNEAVEVIAASPDNDHIKDFDGRYRGYVLCRVGRDTWESDFRIVSTALTRDGVASTRAVWAVEDGSPGAVPA